MSKIGRSFSFWNIFCRNSHWFERQNDTGLVSPGEELGLSILSNANWFFFSPLSIHLFTCENNRIQLDFLLFFLLCVERCLRNLPQTAAMRVSEQIHKKHLVRAWWVLSIAATTVVSSFGFVIIKTFSLRSFGLQWDFA